MRTDCPHQSSSCCPPKPLPLFNKGGEFVPTLRTWGHRHQRARPRLGERFEIPSEPPQSRRRAATRATPSMRSWSHSAILIRRSTASSGSPGSHGGGLPQAASGFQSYTTSSLARRRQQCSWDSGFVAQPSTTDGTSLARTRRKGAAKNSTSTAWSASNTSSRRNVLACDR